MVQSTVSILKELVNFNTTSALTNAPLIDYICDYLAPYANTAIAIIDNGCDPSAPDTGILKANMLVRIGPNEPGGIMLSAHTDCVPVNVSEWKTPPFTLAQQGKKLYGRGTTDMKGFIACALNEVPNWNSMKLHRPIYLTFSYDEEVGCLGVKDALKVINHHNIMPDLCIVGEPTEMEVAYAHKTRADIDLIFSASGGHASKIRDKTITCANTLGSQFIEHLNTNWDTIAAKLNGDGLVSMPSFAPTAWNTPKTHNVIASKSTVHLDFRGAPKVSGEKIEQVFKEQAHSLLQLTQKKKSGFMDIDVQVRMGNSGFLCQDQEALSLAQDLAEKKKLIAVDYVCEAAKFLEAGFHKTIVCGPGSIMQAHKPNEYIKVSELEACSRMMHRIGQYCSNLRNHSLT